MNLLKKMKKNKSKEEKQKNEEIASYQKTSFFQKIPYCVKAIFLKYWFYGALFFFIGMGMSLGGENLAIVGGLIGGVVFDFMYGNLLLMMEDEPNQHDNYIIYKSKKVWSVFINIVFELAVFFITAYIAIACVKIYGDSIWLFQEPLTQGLLALAVDSVLLGIKYLIKLIVNKVKINKENKK